MNGAGCDLATCDQSCGTSDHFYLWGEPDQGRTVMLRMSSAIDGFQTCPFGKCAKAKQRTQMQHRGGGYGAGTSNSIRNHSFQRSFRRRNHVQVYVSQHVVPACALTDWLQQATSRPSHPSTTIHISCEDASRRKGTPNGLSVLRRLLTRSRGSSLRARRESRVSRQCARGTRGSVLTSVGIGRNCASTRRLQY